MEILNDEASRTPKLSVDPELKRLLEISASPEFGLDPKKVVNFLNQTKKKKGE